MVMLFLFLRNAACTASSNSAAVVLNSASSVFTAVLLLEIISIFFILRFTVKLYYSTNANAFPVLFEKKSFFYKHRSEIHTVARADVIIYPVDFPGQRLFNGGAVNVPVIAVANSELIKLLENVIILLACENRRIM